MAAPPGPAPRRVADWLALARRLGVARLDALVLLGHHLGRDRAWLLAHELDDLVQAPSGGNGPATPPAGSKPDPASAAARLEGRMRDDFARRAGGVPLAYLTGQREFAGLMLDVTPAVLVPRPETETLVDWALEALASMPSAEVADLGTGSGAVALAIKAGAPAARVTGTDRSLAALAVAARNARRLGLDVDWQCGHWWQALAGRRFDVVASNPPYVASGDPHLPALVHEPAAALSSGHDGLDAIRTIVAGAPPHLRAGGWLLLEHGHDQGTAVAALFEDAGWHDIRTRPDLAGQPRCTGARWPGAPGG